MFGRGQLDGFFESLFSYLGEAQRIREREQWGITNENGYDGVSKVNIPHEYSDIDIKNNHFYCKHEGFITVYDYAGTKLFTSNDIEELGGDYYLAKVYDEEIVPKDWGFALFKGAKQLTEDIFKPKSRFGLKFNEQGLLLIKYCDREKVSVIINNKGEVVYEHEEEYYFSHHTTLYGVILKTDKGYLNLLTKKYICGKPRRSSESFNNEECLFIKTENTCVYQINMSNGEHLIHGKEDESKKPKTDEEIESLRKEKEEREAAQKKIDDKFNKEAAKWKKLSRNDKCLCGSGKKFKMCCNKTWYEDLKKRLSDK